MGDLSTIFDLTRQIEQGKFDPAVLRRDEKALWWPQRALRRVAMGRLEKAIGQRVIDSQVHAEAIAKEQGASVNAGMWVFGAYDSEQGVKDPTGVTFNSLRSAAQHVEPVATIINRRVQQCTAYCQIPDSKRGTRRRPGFKIRMRIPKQKPTDADIVKMQELTTFILDCGTAPPPRDERSVNWQPGFENFIGKIVRDRLTLDFVAIRRWKADTRLDRRGKFPLVAFEAVDAAKIRKVQRPFLRLQNGVIETSDWKGYRDNTTREIHHVRTLDGGSTESWVDEYTEEELVSVVGSAHTDDNSNGYGNGELAKCINAITIWLFAREYNSSRFQQDTLPRGILSIMSGVNQEQFEAFKMQWAQMMGATPYGMKNRWSNPILASNGGQGAAVNWIPIDLSPREMEYHQFMFMVAIWIHAMFAIHPEETGYESISPFSSALSESSPKAKLESSKDSGFDPLMRWLAAITNRELLWRVDLERRYQFEWEGLDDGDDMADLTYVTTAVSGCIMTTREAYEYRDTPLPELIEDDPAVDIPGTYLQAKALLVQLHSQHQQDKAQEQGMIAAQNQPQGMPPNGQPGQEQGFNAIQQDDGERAQQKQSIEAQGKPQTVPGAAQQESKAALAKAVSGAWPWI